MLRDDLFSAIAEIPSVDVHSHMDCRRFAAEDIGDVLFYHMLQYPYRSAGMPAAKLWLADDSFHGRGRPFEDLRQYWPGVANTGFAWILERILKELYGFEGELDEKAVAMLRERHAAHASQKDWAAGVLSKAQMLKVYTSTDAPPETVPALPAVAFTLERSPEFGIYEFYAWKSRFQNIERWTGVHIESEKDLREVNCRQYDRFDWTNKKAVVWWVSSCADFTPVDEGVVDRIIKKCWTEKKVDLALQGIIEAAYIRSVCEAIRGRTSVFQLVYGTQFITPGPAHPVQRAVPQFAGSLGHLFAEFPDLHFNILNGYEPDEPMLCSLCLGYPNVSLGSFWWQTFYPSIMHSGWHRRLDMVPVSRLVGFFSDARSVDWLFGRLRLTQHVLATVLAEKVAQGYYSLDKAVRVARALMYETPEQLFEGTAGRETK